MARRRLAALGPRPPTYGAGSGFPSGCSQGCQDYLRGPSGIGVYTRGHSARRGRRSREPPGALPLGSRGPHRRGEGRVWARAASGTAWRLPCGRLLGAGKGPSSPAPLLPTPIPEANDESHSRREVADAATSIAADRGLDKQARWDAAAELSGLQMGIRRGGPEASLCRAATVSFLEASW